MKIMRLLLLVFLFVLSTSAFWGGAMLIADAHGHLLTPIPRSTPAHSLFNAYLVFGIALFAVIGAPGVWALWTNLRDEPHAGCWAVLEGVVLLSWLAAESLVFETLIWLDYVYGALGLCLIFSGSVLSCSRYNVIAVKLRRWTGAVR